MENDKEEKLPLKEVLKLLFKASKGFWLVNAINFGDGIAYFGMLNLMTLFLGTKLGMPDSLAGWSVSLLTGLVTLFMFGGGFVSDKLGVRISKLKSKSLCCTATLGGHKVLLLKPSTFMNLSGQAVTEAMAFFKVPPENTIIVFDDISLDPGKLRIRRKGSDGGHNGMKNIIYLSASDTFPRIKVGVGAKPHPDYNLADWVLSRFTEDEVPLIKEAAENACQALELMVQGKTDVAMNRFN